MSTLTSNERGHKFVADSLRALADSIERGEFGSEVTVAQFVHSYGYHDNGVEFARRVTGNSVLVTTSMAFARVAEAAFRQIDGT